MVYNSTEDINMDDDVYTFQHELNDGKSGNDKYYLNLNAKMEKLTFLIALLKL